MSLDLNWIREKLKEIEESYNDDDIYHPGRYGSDLLQHAPNDIAALIAEVERLRSEVTQLRIFRCHVCDSPMRLVEDGDGDGDGYLYACTRAGCHEECLCSTRQVTA